MNYENISQTDGRLKDAKKDKSEAEKLAEAVRALWLAMNYSKYFKPGYGQYVNGFSRFEQLEQLYLCMVHDVPDCDLKETLSRENAKEGKLEEALKTLWLQKTQKQASQKEEKAAKEMGGESQTQKKTMEAAEDHGQPPEAKPRPRRRPDLPGTPYEMEKQLKVVQRQLKELQEKQKDLIGEWQERKEAGCQVRAIVLSDQGCAEGFLAGRKSKKRLDTEKEHINALIQGGYDAAQLDYLLQCRKEGVAWEDIGRFSSPDIPAEMMKKLKEYYSGLREDRKEGKQDGSR